MGRARRLILAGGLLAALSLAAVAHAATRYTVTGSTVTVRNGPADYTASGYVIGTTYGSSGAGPNVSSQGTFDLIRKSANGSWGYGFVHGGFGSWGGGHCGWVLMSELHNSGSSTSASCPAIGGDSPSDDGLSASRIFAPGTYVSGTGGGTVQPAVIIACAYPYAYGNYDPATGTLSNRYPGVLPAGRGTSGHAGVTSGYSGFGTRYETADHRAWLVKDTRSPAGAGKYSVPAWHFIRAECIARIS